MALSAKPTGEVIKMTGSQLEEYFMQYARYFEDSPKPYAIRIGSKTLCSDDTMDLRMQFEQLVSLKKGKPSQTT